MKLPAFATPWLPRPAGFVLLACLPLASPIPGTGTTRAHAQGNIPPMADSPAGQSLKPLWIKVRDQSTGTGSDVSSPIQWEFLDWTTTGDLLFTEEEVAGVNAYLLVSPATGKVLQKLDLPRRQKRGPTDPLRANYLSTYQVLPDGRFILASISYQLDGRSQSRASVQITVLDPRQKLKTTSALELTFNDPTTSRPSGGVHFEGTACAHTRVMGSRLAVANPYFLAEFDLTSLKLLHSTKNPAGAKSIHLLKTGVLWETENKENFAADFGGVLRPVSLEEATKLRAIWDDGWQRKPGRAEGVAKLTADGKVQMAFPGQTAQPLDLLLTSPPTWVQAYQNGRSCLLEIGRTDGSTMFCGLSIPGAATTAAPPAAASPKPTSIPTWTNTAGVGIAGEFIRLESDTLIIRKDGREFRIPMAKLSPASQEQARKLAGPQTTSP